MRARTSPRVDWSSTRWYRGTTPEYKTELRGFQTSFGELNNCRNPDGFRANVCARPVVSQISFVQHASGSWGLVKAALAIVLYEELCNW
ncbi:hypothetical protein RRG08_006837 [Elysia crispata]|uniref:Uncharacterized protein n=1 Tax=Elysia crispata TaxID=231223 RepID=A0AAE0XVW5_9GAST|nr:hypothetical protein RRG08_006837 [Elysia crispata]